jgi:hypothetical protein
VWENRNQVVGNGRKSGRDGLTIAQKRPDDEDGTGKEGRHEGGDLSFVVNFVAFSGYSANFLQRRDVLGARATFTPVCHDTGHYLCCRTWQSWKDNSPLRSISHI